MAPIAGRCQAGRRQVMVNGYRVKKTTCECEVFTKIFYEESCNGMLCLPILNIPGVLLYLFIAEFFNCFLYSDSMSDN